MKILVLMPLDEQHVYMASKIYENLLPDIREHTFAMPMFMEYLINTKQASSWTHAVYDSLISAKNVYLTAEEKKDDLIIIGNVDSSVCKRFDIIFNFQEIDESIEYQDNFINYLLKNDAVINDTVLLDPIKNLYHASDSRLALQNCAATGKFLSSYIKTDPHLEDLISKYNFKYIGTNGGGILIKGKKDLNQEKK